MIAPAVIDLIDKANDIASKVIDGKSPAENFFKEKKHFRIVDMLGKILPQIEKSQLVILQAVASVTWIVVGTLTFLVANTDWNVKINAEAELKRIKELKAKKLKEYLQDQSNDHYGMMLKVLDAQQRIFETLRKDALNLFIAKVCCLACAILGGVASFYQISWLSAIACACIPVAAIYAFQKYSYSDDQKEDAEMIRTLGRQLKDLKHPVPPPPQPKPAVVTAPAPAPSLWQRVFCHCRRRAA